MRMKSHAEADLRKAVKDGYRLYELDTGSSGDDDVLYGFGPDAAEVQADVLFFHDLDEWPAGWTLREVPPDEVFPTEPGETP